MGVPFRLQHSEFSHYHDNPHAFTCLLKFKKAVQHATSLLGSRKVINFPGWSGFPCCIGENDDIQIQYMSVLELKVDLTFKKSFNLFCNSFPIFTFSLVVNRIQ